MARYVLRRVLSSIPLLAVALFAVFMLLQLAPGDPVSLFMPEDATQAEIDAVRERLGLNDPVLTQFGRFLTGLLHLDLGTSLRYSDPVASLIADRLPGTIELALASAVVSLIVGIPLGVIAAMRRGSWIDRMASGTGLIGMSLPNFWLGLLLIIYVGSLGGIFPTGGRAPTWLPMDGPTGFLAIDAVIGGRIGDLPVILQHLALPAITLGTAAAGILMRITRSAMVEVIGEDYVRTARAKGVEPRKVTTRHVLRNALLPVSTVFGLEVASLVSGSIIVETVFAWPGLGELLTTSVGARDFPLVQGIVLVFAVMFVVINLLVDLSYSLIDPRIRFE